MRKDILNAIIQMEEVKNLLDISAILKLKEQGLSNRSIAKKLKGVMNTQLNY